MVVIAALTGMGFAKFVNICDSISLVPVLPTEPVMPIIPPNRLRPAAQRRQPGKRVISNNCSGPDHFVDSSPGKLWPALQLCQKIMAILIVTRRRNKDAIAAIAAVNFDARYGRTGMRIEDCAITCQYRMSHVHNGVLII